MINEHTEIAAIPTVDKRGVVVDGNVALAVKL